MLFRISISLIFGICVSAFALTDEEQKYVEENKTNIQEVEKNFKELTEKKQKVDEEMLMVKPENLKEVGKFKSLTENKADVSEYKKLGENVNLKLLENIYGKNWLDIRLKLEGKPEKKNLIFYLFSTSVPMQTVKNVFLASQKYENLEFYGVLRGISKKTWKYLNSLDEAMNNMTVKVNPLIFKAVDAEVVPAFVIAECPERPYGIIRSKSCKFKAVLYGDVSLDFAVEKFKEEGLWKE
ncbi:hypothetical protein PERMA_A0022 (plasmid) [Persephonella marina EX-H1]|uniref:Type-F conjugative transfer system pilin assembly protein TrbC n=1 Tax=Persephonella marina (strain DSM 14350 / EX-H1) TaxID=123214 RepID=C0QUV1_PERMH|nr:type-F conjugative transfer system pilin assembly protein TrbC [Persephonella marina]ACO04995.1 hypothetical protein PERMA_A0022 [Persephonella marina EX-H1]